jgi:formylglycine-generating enzyme required for sulfatase activity
MDKYEASVWNLAPIANAKTKAKLVTSIQSGTVTLADLQSAGAVQVGLAPGDLATASCPDTGNGCIGVYAVSIPGVTPAGYITWFQAAAAARNSLKRLPTNQEWQVAALGTPDTGGTDNGTTTCDTDQVNGLVSLSATGSRSACISDVGAFDMVGNTWEWVADWVPRSPNAPGSWGAFSNDWQGLVGAQTTGAPGALVRGASRYDHAEAGVFAVLGDWEPSFQTGNFGFRCAR